ncbi:MBL fold metallo-hydrolase [Haloarcula halophila]|uniref:MBL fold metallo-hydrolase n=1 Tax=Haloarcula TaxID=2237 RepID=UPI0023E35B78|nr:MBL fold metallo-hydrolase [Halomicroarcula sp. DFY41]
MELKFVRSAAVVVRNKGTEVLCDPWILDGAYYGSWAHHPSDDISIEDYTDVDYIYVSHIHPDHIHRQTFDRLSTDVPVLIHDFQFDYLKENVQSMGFDAVELPHDERVQLDGDLHINIFAADNCNPENCGRWFGCDWLDDSSDGYGGSHIDTMCVFDNGETTLVNVNDCPFELSKPAARIVKQRYQNINHLLVGYAGAGPYPQCFANLTRTEKRREALAKRQQFYKQGEQFVDLFEPDTYTPFAGTYLLQGQLHELNEYGGVQSLVEMNEFRGVPSPAEAAKYFKQTAEIDSESHKCVPLQPGNVFQIEDRRRLNQFAPPTKAELEHYIRTELADQRLAYESDDFPAVEALKTKIPDAYEKMEEMRRQIGFKSEKDVLIRLSDQECAKISMRGDGYEYCERSNAREPPYVELRVDPRLLLRLLKGPKYAHWNNASVGSHIAYQRDPNVYERGLSYCLNFFHT